MSSVLFNKDKDVTPLETQHIFWRICLFSFCSRPPWQPLCHEAKQQPLQRWECVSECKYNDTHTHTQCRQETQVLKCVFNKKRDAAPKNEQNVCCREQMWNINEEERSPEHRPLCFLWIEIDLRCSTFQNLYRLGVWKTSESLAEKPHGVTCLSTC